MIFILLVLITSRVFCSEFYAENITLTDVPAGNQWPGGDSGIYSSNNELLQKATLIMESKGFVRSFIIVHRNNLVLEEYFHGSKKSDSENIHSASKSILSALVGIALEKGYIEDLDQCISDYIPSSYFKKNKNRDITIRNLLTMSSGIKWNENSTEYAISSEDNYVKAILERNKSFDPGVDFNYSTGDTHLMSAVLTFATGRPLLDFAEEHLFDEIGISVEFWKQDPMGFYSGGCNFFATPMEMARFGQLYLNRGKWNGKRIINSKWISESFNTAFVFSEDWEGYGYYWWLDKIDSYKIYSAWGYAGQMIHIIPELDLVIVSTTDSNSESAVNNEDYSFKIIEEYIIPVFKP